MIAQLSFFGWPEQKTDAKSFVSNGILTDSLLCQSWLFTKKFAKNPFRFNSCLIFVMLITLRKDDCPLLFPKIVQKIKK